MKALVFVLMGLLFLSLVAGASYPSPFTEDTVIVLGADLTPSINTVIPATFSTPDTDTLISAYIETGNKISFEKAVCGVMKGCWDINCFQYGYRRNDTYCGWIMKKAAGNWVLNTTSFIDQKDSIEQCNNSFECKSNFCFNGECVDTIRTVDEGIVRIDKSDLEELRSIIENGEESMEGNYDEEVSKSFFSSLIGLFKNIFGL